MQRGFCCIFFFRSADGDGFFQKKGTIIEIIWSRSHLIFFTMDNDTVLRNEIKKNILCLPICLGYRL